MLQQEGSWPTSIWDSSDLASRFAVGYMLGLQACAAESGFMWYAGWFNVKLTKARAICEEGNQSHLHLKKSPSRIGWWTSLWYIFLIDDRGGKAQLLVGVTPGLMVLECVNSRLSKPVSRTLLASVSVPA